MKPYALPRNNDVESPDVGDIILYGLKSSFRKGMHRQTDAKGRIRRIWKRKARRAVREACEE